MRSLFSKIVYQKRFVVLGWFIGFFAIMLLTVSFYPSFSELAKSFNNLPEAMRKLIGDALSFQTVGGYIRQQVFALRMPLLMIILSIALFHGLTTGDEQKGLTETHLTLPLSRARLLTEKALAGVVALLLASLGAVVGIQVSLLLIHESYSILNVLRDLVNCLLLSMTFGMLSFMFGSITAKRGLSLGVASGVAFTSYLINSMAPSVSALSFADKLTPFHFYVTNSPLEAKNVLILVAISAVLFLIGMTGFSRRDLKLR